MDLNLRGGRSGLVVRGGAGVRGVELLLHLHLEPGHGLLLCLLTVQELLLGCLDILDVDAVVEDVVVRGEAVATLGAVLRGGLTIEETGDRLIDPLFIVLKLLDKEGGGDGRDTIIAISSYGEIRKS